MVPYDTEDPPTGPYKSQITPKYAVLRWVWVRAGPTRKHLNPKPYFKKPGPILFCCRLFLLTAPQRILKAQPEVLGS